jgi:hypothetical protein
VKPQITRRSQAAASAAAFVVLLAVYAATLAPTVTF